MNECFVTFPHRKGIDKKLDVKTGQIVSNQMRLLAGPIFPFLFTNLGRHTQDQVLLLLGCKGPGTSEMDKLALCRADDTSSPEIVYIPNAEIGSKSTQKIIQNKDLPSKEATKVCYILFHCIFLLECNSARYIKTSHISIGKNDSTATYKSYRIRYTGLLPFLISTYVIL